MSRLRPSTQYGRYRTEGCLRSGALSQLYAATYTKDPETQVRCIIKGPGDAKGIEPDLVHRLLVREGEILAALDHRSVVRLLDRFDLGRSLGMVLEHIDGLSVADILRSLKRRQDTLPVRIGLAIFRQLVEALAYLHSAKDAQGQPLLLRHCDVTPGNLMLTYEGELKILDFGISQWRADRTNFSAGLCLGTPGYFAPEQICGGPSTDRADVFAAGVVACRLLGAAHSPFARRTLKDCLRATVGSHRPKVQDILRHCPSAITDLIEQMLQVPALARPSCAALLQILAGAIDDVEDGAASRVELSMFLRGLALKDAAEAPRTSSPRAPSSSQRPIRTRSGVRVVPVTKPIAKPRVPSQTRDLPPLASSVAFEDLGAALRQALQEDLPESWLEGESGIPPQGDPAPAEAKDTKPATRKDNLPEAAPEDVVLVDDQAEDVEVLIDRGIEAILDRDFRRAYVALQSARQADPDNRIVRANLQRLQQLGFDSTQEACA